ncbi:MAG: MFS transporter [Planctomycetales bacterium]
MHEPHSPPTRARMILLALLASLVFILYLDRVCIGKAAPRIEEELGISHTQMGYLFGAFTIAYGLFEVPTGRWGDRYGSRGVLTRIVLWWSLFTALTGCVPVFSWDTGWSAPWSSATGEAARLAIDSFAILLVVRFLFGAGEAGALPNNARVVARWFPLRERGVVQGTILTCQQLGGACAPILAGYMIEGVGWRWSFVLFGFVGIVWAALFYQWFRDNPAEHPGTNAAERALIAAGREGTADDGAHPPVPWGRVAGSLNVWLLGAIMNCGAFAAYMYMFWFPTYLQKGCDVEEIRAGWLAGMVMAGGATGAWCGGWLTGRIEQWTGEPIWGRRLLGGICLTLGALALSAIPFLESPISVALCATLACAVSQTQIGNWWSVVMLISGRHVGALFGLMNSMGVVGAFTSPLFFGWFADWRKSLGFLGRAQWDPAFWLYAGVLFTGAVCWLFVDPSHSVVDDPDDSLKASG